MMLEHTETKLEKNTAREAQEKNAPSPAASDSWQSSPPALVPSKVANDVNHTKKTCRSPQDPYRILRILMPLPKVPKKNGV